MQKKAKKPKSEPSADKGWWSRENLNSIGVVIAILTGLFGAYQGWEAKRGQNENVSTAPSFTPQCQVQYQKVVNSGAIGLCWLVTISNTSSSKLSIVAADVWNRPLVVDEKGRGHYRGMNQIGGFRKFENEGDEQPPQFPIILDGGESKNILVRVPVLVPTAVAQAIESIIQSNGGSAIPMVLGKLQHELFERGLDYMGGKPVVLGPGSYMLKFDHGPIMNQLELTSGRGQKFYSLLTYPPPTGTEFNSNARME